MLKLIRRHLTYANVTATLALFIALGGSAVALTQINGSMIRNRSIPGRKLVKQTVGGAEVNVSTLGKVPRAAKADQAAVAATAVNAQRLGGLGPSAYLGVAGTAADSNRLNGVVAEPPFQSLALASGCSSYSGFVSPPGYLIDAFGFVHLRGMLTCTSSNAFTLPVGARPGAWKFFRVAMSDTTQNTELLIFPDGTGRLMTSGSGPNFVASLEGVTFRAGD